MMDLQIRPYSLKDKNGLSFVIDSVCSENEWMLTRQFIPTPEWLHALSEPYCFKHLLLVALYNEDIIGWCRIFPRNCSTKVYSGELGIGLKREFREVGIGHKFITSSLEWARSQEFQNITLSVSIYNQIALHLFSKCNFEKQSYYNDRDDILLMSHKITL